MGGRSGKRKDRGLIYEMETEIKRTVEKKKYSNIIRTEVKQKRKKKKTDE